MLDFVAILRTSIDRHSDPSREVRVVLYDRARQALGRLAETHTPRELEDYDAALKDAIDEIERSYDGSNGTTPLSYFSPGEDRFLFNPRANPAYELTDARPRQTSTFAPPKGNETSVSGAPVPNHSTVAGGGMRLPQVRRPAYDLASSASSECSICRKWAVCIDSAHCWNRD